MVCFTFHYLLPKARGAISVFHPIPRSPTSWEPVRSTVFAPVKPGARHGRRPESWSNDVNPEPVDVVWFNPEPGYAWTVKDVPIAFIE